MHLWSMTGIRLADIHLAIHKLKTGDLDGTVDIIGACDRQRSAIG